MANNNKGLQFNPFLTTSVNASSGPGYVDLTKYAPKKRLPEIAGNYLAPAQPVNYTPIQWNPDRLQKAQQAVQAFNALKPNELNPLYKYNKWKQGLRGLSSDELRNWELSNLSKIEDKTERQKERIWKNQEFIKTFGLDTFHALDMNERDKLFESALTEDAIKQKYYGNPNIDQLLDLTPKGRVELIKSDYQPDINLKEKNKENSNKRWWDYSLNERVSALASDISSRGKEGLMIGSFTGSIPGAALGSFGGAVWGALTGLFHPEDANEKNAFRQQAENDEILNKIVTADNDRKKEESKDEINKVYADYLRQYHKGILTEDDIDDAFDRVALNRKETSEPDELGNTEEYNYTGSNYYSAFKDSDEFQHFGPTEKLKYLAQTDVLNKKYGRSSALSTLDQDMQDYVYNHQSAADWTINTGKGILVGGVANIGMKTTGLGALAAKLFYGDEGLANYLAGKDASGSGEENSWINNINYWNKVDELNTFDVGVMEEAERNGGISKYNNVYKPGTEGDFLSWQTLNEAIKMNKFAWSDLLTNMGLAKIVGKAVKIAGGIELAPGVLASESTLGSKVVNKLGSAAVIGGSSLGIDAAYGMQTYKEVLDKNNAKVDAIIDQDTEAEVAKRLASPEAQKEFRTFVDAENARRKKNAGERGKWIPVDEEKAWEDYIKHTEKVVREEQESLHAEDRQQAANAAADAYAVDATIEAARMAPINAAFKSYLFDKGTLNAVKANNPYLNTTTKEGAYIAGKSAYAKKVASAVGKNIWGGFHSNYFDDVTVGFAKGFGLQDYNNYLYEKYNPAAYGTVIDDYVNPFIAGMAGAENAMSEGRSFLDGTIGALGTVFTVSPNIVGMTNHSEKMKQLAESITKAEKEGKKLPGIHWTEKLSDYINNPILQAVADAKAASRMTQQKINNVNNTIKDNAYALDHIVETVGALNQKAISREGTSMLEAEDAKDKEAFALANSLLSLKNSEVVANAQAEPDKTTWSKKKKFSHMLSRGLNALLGVNFFEEAESSYTRAMQALQDAATIGEAKDDATIQRQQGLIDTFLKLDQNKNIIKNMSEEEQTAFAQERLKKNATSMLNMMDKAEKLQKKFEKSITAFTPELQQQLMYQYLLDDRWKDRRGDIEQWITGEENPVQNESSEDMLIAKYGSMEGYERAKKAQEKKVEVAKEALEKAEAEAKKQNNPSLSLLENAKIKAARLLQKKTAKNNLKKAQENLKKIEKDGRKLGDVFDSESPVIKAERILRLNPNDRLKILDDFYRNDYSEAQQAEIDKAKNMLIADGTSINEAMEKVKDAAILTNRIEDNMEVAKRIMQNPAEASLMQEALIANRKKKVIDYFNDKVVAEAINDFRRDSESTLSVENAANKAQNYSTAVLNRMLVEVEKQLSRTRKADEADDKTLDILKTGIENVLTQRDKKLKDTVDLDKYINKTKKVDHTEAVEKPIYNGSTGKAEGAFLEEQTIERELSQNDKQLLEYAIDYAAEKGMSIDELEQKVQEEDFNNYVQERNHSSQALAVNPITGNVEQVTGTVENRTNQVSPEYMSSLLKDVVDAFKKHKETVDAAKTEKPVASSPKSVATAPVEVKGEKPAKEQRNEGDARPDEEHIDLNSKSVFSGLTVHNKPEGSSTEGAKPSTKNAEILNDASVTNSEILEDIKILLDEVDKMPMDDNTRNEIKDIIRANVTNRSFTTIKDLQGALAEDGVMSSQAGVPQLGIKATALAELDIQGLKEKRSRTSEEKTDSKKTPESTTGTSNEDSPFIFNIPMRLTTRDLGAMMRSPAFKEFIERHKIVEFLKKFAPAFNKSYREKTSLHQSQAYLIYDPALAAQVEEEMNKSGKGYHPEMSAPVIMALEITDKNRDLVEDDSQLIYIKNVPSGKSHYYQPLGIMPDNQAKDYDSEEMRISATRMSAVRNRIPFGETKDVELIRLAPARGKKNGTPIKANINRIDDKAGEVESPHATKDTPKKNVQQLMDENIASATEAFVGASEAEKQVYEEAKKKGLTAVRGTNLYKKLRKAFIKRLFKRNIPGETSEDKKREELDFLINKGISGSYPKIVLTKKLSETNDRNSGRPIIDILREVDTDGSNAEELINSNSRFYRLFKGLSALKLGKGLFNEDGKVTNKVAFNTAITTFEESIKRVIGNNLSVGRDQFHIRVEVGEGAPSHKPVYIHAYYGDINSPDSKLATLTTSYTGQISKTELASFLKDLILDKEGTPRISSEDSNFELVKWQVNYEDANTANNEKLSEDERGAARTNLEQLYDDGIFEMQTTKLAYPSSTVTIGDAGGNLKSLYAREGKARPETPAPAATETKAAFETETPTGKVDADTGARTETPTRESILANPKVQRTLNIVNKMISDSETRNVTENNKYYDIAGQLWARVTSLKYAIRDGLRRFTSDPTKTSPALLIGNSFDEFGRNVFNRIYDKLNLANEKDVENAFGGYPNATAKNYAKAFEALKQFEARLLDKQQVIIATGNSIEKPGKITSKGYLNVIVRNNDGTTSTRQIRVAGTIDAIAVDINGDLHLYDFKTHRAEYPLTAEKAKEDGYDIQQSEYAEFIESEYLQGTDIKVKSVNIIPIGASYPPTAGHIFEEAEIKNQIKWTRVGDMAGDKPRFENLEADIFNVEEEFELPRLSKEELTASYEKLSEEDKKALVEIIQDQSENPAKDKEITTDNIVAAQPEVAEEEQEKEEGGFSRKGKLGKRKKTTSEKPSTEEILHALNPKEESDFINKLEELKKGCGGKPS